VSDVRIVFPYDGYEHIGIGSLAAVALSRGHDVSFLHVDAGDYIRGLRRPGLRRVRENASAIAALRPDVVAFSLNSFSAGEYMRLAAAVREREIATLAGGPHATAEPSLTLEGGGFTGLVCGEAEDVFADAVEHAAAGLGHVPPWLWTREHDATVLPTLPDLNSLPFPEKERFYRIAPMESRDYKIITSRGCAFRCTFCAGGSGRSSRVRRRSVDNVLGELRWAKSRFNPATVYFLDDNFSLDPAWLNDLLRAYSREIGLPFHAILHPSCCDDAVAHMLAEGGCFKVRLGVQSLTPRVKRLIGRCEPNEQVARAITAARDAGLRVEIDHMVNLPDESLEDAREGISWYNDHRPDAIKVYWLTPLPGTAWFDEARARGTLSERSAGAIRRGTGFGRHSYLFYAAKEFYDRRWLGIHALLVFLPHLPRRGVTLLVRLRADRLLRIPSFVLLVGVARLLTILRGGDRVGETHIVRLWRRYTFRSQHSAIGVS